MSRYADGEVIELCWDGPEMAVYVKGHMEPEKARAIIEREHDGLRIRQPVPKYGRWSCSAFAPEGCDMVLAVYTDRGRGRFPLMEAEVLGRATK